MRRILSILGSSGSIGRQTLDVAEVCGHQVAAITVNRSVKLAEEQARKFRPRLAVAVDENAALNALEVFSERWDKKYPKISISWKNNWPNLSNVIKFGIGRE